MLKHTTQIFLGAILVASLLFPYLETSAAVPVHVVGFEADTDFEKSLEKFMFDLFQTLQKREEDFTTSFELQNVEKAREDVGKLVYETRKELQDKGEKITIKDPATGADYIITKEGRIITNVDDFLYEEPLQKSREFVYCYFGDWKFFPFGDASEEQCRTEEVTDSVTGENYWLYKAETCDSNWQRDELGVKIMLGLIRKLEKFVIAPPREFYTKSVCSVVSSSLPMLITEEGKTASPFYATLRQSLSGIEKEGKIWSWDELMLSFDANHNIASTRTSVENYARQIIDEYEKSRFAQYIAGQGIRPEKMWAYLPTGQTIAGISAVLPYETENVISPAAILLQKMQAATQAEFDLAQKSFLDLRPLLEDVRLDPNLLDAPYVGGLTRRQILERYNLGQNTGAGLGAGALGDPDFLRRFIGNTNNNFVDGGDQNKWTILDAWLKPKPPSYKTFEGTLIPGGLPAPWEDVSDYNRTPLNYTPTTLWNNLRTDLTATGAGAPPPEEQWKELFGYVGDGTDLGTIFPLYRWYRDVVELYQYTDNPSSSPDNWDKLLKKWFGAPIFGGPIFIETITGSLCEWLGQLDADACRNALDINFAP